MLKKSGNFDREDFLSIVMPVYRESRHLVGVLENVRDFAQIAVSRFEIVLVDDGSPDDTWQVIEENLAAFPMIRAIRLSRNFGKESALCAGLEMARGDAVVVMDADGQHPPALLPEMVRIWREENADIVEGVKASRGREALLNKTGASLFYYLWTRLSGFELRGASDFKLLGRNAVDAYLEMGERNVFFRGMAAWIGFRRTSIPFEVAERVGGNSGWRILGLFKLALNGIAAFSSLPLQIITFLGMCFLAFSIFFAIYTVVLQLIGHSVSGFATVILLLLIIGSFLMISLGIIGIYLARIYDEIKGRPRYLVAQSIGVSKENAYLLDSINGEKEAEFAKAFRAGTF